MGHEWKNTQLQNRQRAGTFGAERLAAAAQNIKNRQATMKKGMATKQR